MSIDLDDYIETTRKELEDEQSILDESNEIKFIKSRSCCSCANKNTINKIKIIFKTEYISHDDLRSITFVMGDVNETMFVDIHCHVTLLDLILLYMDLKTIVQSNEVTILLPNISYIQLYGSDFIDSLIGDVYGYKTVHSIRIPRYEQIYIGCNPKPLSKIIIEILDDSIVSLCSIKSTALTESSTWQKHLV